MKKKYTPKEYFLEMRSKNELKEIAKQLNINVNKMSGTRLVQVLMRYSYKNLIESFNK